MPKTDVNMVEAEPANSNPNMNITKTINNKKSLLPFGLLSLYFVHAFFLSFPMTAYGNWLFNVIHMSPATTSIYYGIAFYLGILNQFMD